MDTILPRNLGSRHNAHGRLKIRLETNGNKLTLFECNNNNNNNNISNDDNHT